MNQLQPSQWPTIPVLQPIEAKCRSMPHMPDWDDLGISTAIKYCPEAINLEYLADKAQVDMPTAVKAKKLMKCDTCDYHSHQPFWKDEWTCQVCEAEAEQEAIEAQDGYDTMCDENRTFGR